MPVWTTPYVTIPILLLIFYFLMLRPQRKQEKERREMLDGLKKNDQVTTVGGLYGTVSSVGEDTVTLRVDDARDVRVKVMRGSIQGRVKQAKESEGAKEKGEAG